MCDEAVSCQGFKAYSSREDEDEGVDDEVIVIPNY